MIDDEDTAPRPIIDAVSAPRHGPTDPHIYLPQPPLPAEKELLEALLCETGDPAPAHWVVKVALRLWRQVRWSDRLQAALRRGRRYAMVCASFAAANIGVFGINWLHAHDEHVAEVERAAAADRAEIEYRRVTEQRLNELRQDLIELRASLRKLTGVDPKPDLSLSFITPYEGHTP